jgi:hypothetical protein
MIRNGYIYCLWFIATLAIGCSGGSPTLPSEDAGNLTPESIPAVNDSPTLLWGLWDVTVDTSGRTVDIVPMRGLEFTVDVVKFLQPPVGLISGISIAIKDVSEFPTEGRLILDVTLGHPFPGMDQFTGFDVYGVFTHNGGLDFAHGSDTIDITDGVDSAILENADGYTVWMSPELFPPDGSIFTFLPGALGTKDFPTDPATANGYKYFADSLGSVENVAGFYADPFNASMRGKFSPGSLNTREYQLKFPVAAAPVVKFQYAVTANWEIADKTLTGDPYVLDVPGDFPISANAHEPFYVNVVDNSTTWYVDDTHRGGNINLDLEVFTWRGLEGIGNIHISSSDDLVPGGTTFFNPTFLVWSPGAVNSSVTTVEITGAMPSSVVGQEILIAVEAAPHATYDQGFGTPAPNLPLAGYFRHTVKVANVPPQGEITAMGTATIEPYFDGFGPEGSTQDPIPTEWWLTLDASASTGTIFQYLWEMNGDDLFDDAEGMIVSAGFPDIGTHVIKLKVTDGVGGEDVYELPGSYEVVKGTYVWANFPGGSSDGTRDLPFKSIMTAANDAGQGGYVLVRGDDGAGGQCIYQEDLTFTDEHSGTRIQGYYGDYVTDKPPMQIGFVRVEGDNVTFDGFEVTGPSYSTYMPYGHRSKLGSDQADNILFRHLYIHDLDGDCKAILCWFGGSLLVQNVLEVNLNGMYQKNQAHEDTTDPGPQLDFLNCTMDRLGSTPEEDCGLYVSSGGGADFLPTIINCIWTDIADGADTKYIRRQGPFGCFSDYTCTSDTPTPPDGGTYYTGVDLGDYVIYDDPLYVDPFSDHHLQTGSPAVDAGDPDVLDIDGSVSDMGSYGGPYGDWDFEN